MRWGILLGLFLIVLPVHADDLFCQGSIFVNGQQIQSTRVLRLDVQAMTASTTTVTGNASGPMKATPELYMGTLYSQSGHEYWFNLNRYTGDFVVATTGQNGQPDRGEFSGICVRANRKF